jgi:hypothetical protein
VDCFQYGDRAAENAYGRISVFSGLRRKPVKKTRLMTHEGILAWVVSAEALGWVVKYDSCDWRPPQSWCYDDSISSYRRARIAPDGTISDEQCFELEVME